ncbi:MAG: hypothetical protein ACRDWD_07570 [Acidimicrobiia bacterium]
MPKYLIEREIPGAGTLGDRALADISSAVIDPTTAEQTVTQ